MKRIEAIVCPTDLSPCSEQAIDWAGRLAEELDATLHLLHVTVLHQEEPYDTGFYPPDPEVAYETAREGTSTAVQGLLSRFAGRPISVETAERRAFSAASAILDYAREQTADLVVMGTHGRSAIGRFFLGSVASEVVRNAECPVLTMRQRERRGWLGGSEPIVMPLDFSERAEEGLTVALDLARRFGAGLERVHVINQPVWAEVYGFAGTYDLVSRSSEVAERCEQALRSLAEKVGVDVPYEVRVLIGRAGHEIADHARAAGLVVVPSQGLTGIPRLLLGSTAEEIVRAASCPVLTLKTSPETG